MGDYPDIMFRTYLDRVLSLKDLENMFKSIMYSSDFEGIKGKPGVSSVTNTACMTEFAEKFVMPKSVYVSSVIKDLLEQNKNVVAFVNSLHYKDVRKRLQDNIYYRGLDINKFLNRDLNIKSKFEETDIEKVKKQAILDNLLDDYPWMSQNVFNPF